MRDDYARDGKMVEAGRHDRLGPIIERAGCLIHEQHARFADESPRNSYFYVNDDGLLVALRVNQWKVVFHEQRAKTMALWAEPFVELRVPKIFNLRTDPFERADENSNTYWDWVISHAYIIYYMQAAVAREIDNFVAFPPRQKPASFNLDRVLEQLQDASGGGQH